MTNEIDKARLLEIINSKPYKRTRKESKAQYARRVASIMFRGWSFLGVSHEIHEARVAAIESMLP